MSTKDGSAPNAAVNYATQEDLSHQNQLKTSNTSPRIGLIASVATTSSIVICYGTLVLINLLGQVGLDITVNETLWAGAISLTSVIAVVGLAVNLTKHRQIPPVVLGGWGAVLINYVMFAQYYIIIEFIGFTLLCAAVVLDWRSLERSTRL